MKSVFLKFLDFIFKDFFHGRFLQSVVFWLRLNGVNFMFFFLNKVLKVISFLLNKFKSLLVLILLRLILINPLQIQFLNSIFVFCFSAGKSEFKIVKLSWKFKHVFLLFFYFHKKLLICSHLLLSMNFFLLNKDFMVFNFLLQFLDWVLFGPEFLLKITDCIFMS